YVSGLPAKQIELAREVVPGAVKIGVLANSDDAKGPPQLRELQEAGHAVGAVVAAAWGPTPDALDGALEELRSQNGAGIIVLQTSMLLSERRKIAAAAATMRLPAIYGYREHVDAGGLISYGVDLHDCFRHSAAYVHKILNGAAPGELPVEFPTR